MTSVSDHTAKQHLQLCYVCVIISEVGVLCWGHCVCVCVFIEMTFNEMFDSQCNEKQM